MKTLITSSLALALLSISSVQASNCKSLPFHKWLVGAYPDNCQLVEQMIDAGNLQRGFVDIRFFAAEALAEEQGRIPSLN